MNLIRNLLGATILVVSATFFQIGFMIMTEDMKQSFAERFVKKFVDTFMKD